MVTSSIVW